MSDTSLVTHEMFVSDNYVFLDALPHYAIVIHKTASPGMSTAEAIARYFQEGSDGRHVSSHYVIGKDGTIVQCVREKDGAGANSAVPYELGRSPIFTEDINWNLRTISIEHVDDSSDNSQALTPAQKQASFTLVRDIAQRHSIPSSRIVGHDSLQPRSKPLCPHTYPLEELRSYVAKQNGEKQMSCLRNSNGEVIDTLPVSQFYPSKTEYACGFFAAAALRYSGKPTMGTGLATPLEVEKWALAQYVNEYGSDGPTQVGGVSIDDMHRLLIAALPASGSSHYMDLDISPSTGQASDLAHIYGALSSGYPVVCTVSEVSILDKELGKSPYFWGASGNHVVIITGMTSSGDLLVHDSANITGSLTGANSVRSQPRTYDHSTIDMSWASMARMPWLEPFPANWSPITGVKLNQLVVVATQPTQAHTGESILNSPIENGPNKNGFIVTLWEIGSYDYSVHNPKNSYPARETIIFSAYRNDLCKGINHGPVLSIEIPSHDENNEVVTLQCFGGAIACEHNGSVRWL